jgi:hypothetical protein
MPLVSFSTMFFSGMTTGLPLRRLVTAATLLFVVFLTLHFHAYSNSQVSKECACLHGARTQLAAGSSVAAITPQPGFFRVAKQVTSIWIDDDLEQIYVRGPPSQTSL